VMSSLGLTSSAYKDVTKPLLSEREANILEDYSELFQFVVVENIKLRSNIPGSFSRIPGSL